jgi:hypothetical protein
MKIFTDTLVELNEAIDVHEANGWTLMERVRTVDGTYTATLVRAPDQNKDQQEIKFK